MEHKRFRTGLFGFRKSDVCGYIQELNNEFSERLQKKEDDCAKLRAELSNSQMQLSDLQKEKSKVADALILAEEKANEFVSAAEQTAEDKRRAMEEEYNAEQEKLRAIRAEISSVREAAINAIKRFEEKMSDLESSISKKDEDMSAEQEKKAGAEEKAAPVHKVPIIPADSNQKINIIKLS